MKSILIPIIMITVTMFGSGFFYLYIKKLKNKGKRENTPQKTAQDFINVRDIEKHFLYTQDNMAIIFLKIESISIDLYSKSEKNSIIKQLTSELSSFPYPFKFMAVSRPIDISPLIHEMTEQMKHTSDRQKELLRQEILNLSGYALSGEIVERQFYISLWSKFGDEENSELLKRGILLTEKFNINGISSELIEEKEIVRLLNLVHNPSYSHLEDEEYEPSIPTLVNKEDNI